jgi:hypothetical protein
MKRLLPFKMDKWIRKKSIMTYSKSSTGIGAVYTWSDRCSKSETCSRITSEEDHGSGKLERTRQEIESMEVDIIAIQKAGTKKLEEKKKAQDRKKKQGSCCKKSKRKLQNLLYTKNSRVDRSDSFLWHISKKGRNLDRHRDRNCATLCSLIQIKGGSWMASRHEDEPPWRL